MKNAFNKEIFREIKNTFDRFLAIFIIIALGVSFFAGIGSTGSKMRAVQDQYLTEQNLMDIRVISNFGLNDNDVKAISETEGIKQILATYNIDALAEQGGVSLLIKVHALDTQSGINKPLLLSGRLPEKNSEAVAETALLNKLGLRIGDIITLEGGNKTNILNSLRTKRYTIVGTVKSPYYISNLERGNGSIGSGKIDCYMMIPRENFTQEVYSEVFATVTGADEVLCFGDEYQDLVGDVTDRLKELEPIRAAGRAAEMTQKAYENVNRQIEIINNKRKETSAEFDATEARLAMTRKELDKLTEELAEKRNKATQSLAALKLARGRFGDGINEIDAALDSVYDTKSELLALPADFQNRDDGLSIAEQTASELESQRGALSLNLAEIGALISETEINLRLIEQSERQLLESRVQLDKQQAEFDDAKRQAEADLAEAGNELNRLKKDLDDIGEPDWYILDRESNAGFLSYREDSDKIQAIGRTFPLFLFLVAALICLTTMTRLVEERRIEIGTLKALGYGDMKILSKYVVYAVVPTLLGGVAGGYIGMILFPGIIMNAYAGLYTIPASNMYIDYTQWGTGILLGVLTTTIPAVLTCKNELNENPASLFRYKPPKAGKKTVFESISFFWKQLSFTYKVTIRNIVRYKKRFFMTVFGIAGCTALLLAGFGLRDSVKDLANKQFGQIFKYDMKVIFSDNAKQKEITYVSGFLAANPITWSGYAAKEKRADAETETGKSEKVTLIIPSDPEYFEKYILLKERETQTYIPLQENSVILNEKLAKLLNVSVGGEFTIRDGDDYTVTAVVTGICENYLNNYIYMHKNIYKSLFNEDAEYNAVFALLDPSASSKETAEFANSILDKKNVSSVTFTENVLEPFNRIIQSLDIVLFVIVLSAGVLAFVVLYNLTNININERIRELATIEVLGFRDREVSGYVYRENAILTAIGILLGFVLGYFLHLYLINTVESRLMMFSREIWRSSYLYALIITAAFSLAVNKITSLKLKKINMIEALKSIE